MIGLLERFFLYGALGWCVEILFTGLHAAIFRRDRSATGKTYLWMLPIYGGAALALERIHGVLAPVGWPGRVVVYLLVIYAAELASGHVLRRVLGRCPWDYGTSRWSIAGLIRLDYAPFWLLLGVLFEPLQLVVGSLALTIRTVL